MARAQKFNLPELQPLLQAAERYSYLTVEEERMLADHLQNGTPAQKKAARDRLVLSHLRLAIKISRTYFAGSRMSQDELAQQAALGLFQATNKFDARARFSTYATRWVYESVKMHASRFNGIVSVPSSADKKRQKVKRALTEVDRGLGFSFEDLAKELKMKPNDVAMFMTLGQESSLHAPVGEDGDSTHQDFLKDPNPVDPLEDMDTRQMHSTLHQALDELSPREKHVLMSRFGVDCDEEQTLDKLATEYGVTRERIRQIEVAAKKKLAKGPFAEMLATFL